MICQHCKNQISDTSKFCPFCGKPVAVQPQPSVQPRPEGQAAAEMRTVRPAAPQPNPARASVYSNTVMPQGVPVSRQNGHQSEVRRSSYPSGNPVPTYNPSSQPQNARPYPPSGSNVRPAPTEVAYGHHASERGNGLIDAVKSIAKSPVVIILAAALSLTFLFSIIVFFNELGNIYNDMASILYTFTSIISGIPVLLTVVALWLSIAGGFKRSSHMPTAGISILKGVSIYNIVALSIFALIAFFALMAMFGAAINYGFEEAMVVTVFTFIIVLIVFVFAYIYNIKLLGCVSTAKYAAVGGPVKKNASMFVIVFLFISSAFTFIGLFLKLILPELIYDIATELLSYDVGEFVASLFRASAFSIITDLINIAISVTGALALINFRNKLARFVR